MQSFVCSRHDMHVDAVIHILSQWSMWLLSDLCVNLVIHVFTQWYMCLHCDPCIISSLNTSDLCVNSMISVNLSQVNSVMHVLYPCVVHVFTRQSEC